MHGVFRIACSNWHGMEGSVGVNQWGEDVGWGPTELSPPESEQGGEGGAVQLGILQCSCRGDLLCGETVGTPVHFRRGNGGPWSFWGVPGQEQVWRGLAKQLCLSDKAHSACGFSEAGGLGAERDTGENCLSPAG